MIGCSEMSYLAGSGIEKLQFAFWIYVGWNDFWLIFLKKKNRSSDKKKGEWNVLSSSETEKTNDRLVKFIRQHMITRKQSDEVVVQSFISENTSHSSLELPRCAACKLWAVLPCFVTTKGSSGNFRRRFMLIRKKNCAFHRSVTFFPGWNAFVAISIILLYFLYVHCHIHEFYLIDSMQNKNSGDYRCVFLNWTC